MKTADNTRMAYIAREPGQPGAVAYINAGNISARRSQELIEGWINRGWAVEKVTLAEAFAELSRYTAAQQIGRLARGVTPLLGLGDDTPIMLRPQAD